MKKHSIETKKKISESQRKRYNTIRKAIEKQNILQLANTDYVARLKEIKRFLNNSKTSFDTIQQAINFIAFLLGKDHFKTMVREEINKLIIK